MGKNIGSTAVGTSTLGRCEALTHDRMTPVVEGHLLHVHDGFDIAIYTRSGVSWVAELRQNRASLIEATVWFRFHSGPLRYRDEGVAVLDTASALTPTALAQIDRLHRQTDRSTRGTLLPAIVDVVRRWTGRGRSTERTSTPARAEHLG